MFCLNSLSHRTPRGDTKQPSATCSKAYVCFKTWVKNQKRKNYFWKIIYIKFLWIAVSGSLEVFQPGLLLFSRLSVNRESLSSPPLLLCRSAASFTFWGPSCCCPEPTFPSLCLKTTTTGGIITWTLQHPFPLSFFFSSSLWIKTWQIQPCFLMLRLICGKADTYNIKQQHKMSDGGTTASQESSTTPVHEEETEARGSTGGTLFILIHLLLNIHTVVACTIKGLGAYGLVV